jgi:hypothetical protein
VSAPLRLEADDLTNLAQALNRLTATSHDTLVQFAVYGPLQAQVGEDGPVVNINWDASVGQYIIDDRVGS